MDDKPVVLLGTHKKDAKNLVEEELCVICDEMTYLSGYGVSTKTYQIYKMATKKKVIAIECFMTLMGQFAHAMSHVSEKDYGPRN